MNARNCDEAQGNESYGRMLYFITFSVYSICFKSAANRWMKTKQKVGEISLQNNLVRF